MKKIFLGLTIIVFLAVIVISCKSGEKCAAYGERQRYQIERNH